MHTMKKILLAAAVGMIPMGGAALAKPLDNQGTYFQFRMSLDATGRIIELDYTGKGGNDDPVALKLEPLIRSWAFTPGKVDGVPMPTDTTLTVVMGTLNTSGDRVELGIVDAYTGPFTEKITVPRYPGQALADGIEARVIAGITVGAKGRAKVEISAASPMNNAYRKSFESALMEASKGWRFRPETVGGHPVVVHMRYAVDFCLRATPCARVKDEPVARDGTLAKSVPIALDSQVKLVTQVAGTTL